MKKSALFLLIVLGFALVGCAQKTASEQLRDDMNKAAKKLDKEVKGFLNN